MLKHLATIRQKFIVLTNKGWTMLATKLLICMYGLCFNPSQIVTLDDVKVGFSGPATNCRLNFSRGEYQAGTDYTVVKDKKCSVVVEEINKEITKKRSQRNDW